MKSLLIFELLLMRWIVNYVVPLGELTLIQSRKSKLFHYEKDIRLPNGWITIKKWRKNDFIDPMPWITISVRNSNGVDTTFNSSNNMKSWPFILDQMYKCL